ncbi:glycosyltransferase [Leucobacter sp. W1478]|uniref:glycosyltransferase n=1 Tax=Leucobacter sp. W1478 TaxID=3439065 RepID=UPI003F406825
MIRHIAVLIPARDEQDRVERCLSSVLAAKRACPVPVSITLVADGCRDGTAARALKCGGVDVLEVDCSNVGAARGIAARHALLGVKLPTEEVWLANTDADSVVPENWFTVQLGFAEAGYGIVVGTVRPDPAEYPEYLQREWKRTHVKGRPNGHIHGANLGIRASAYLEVGGYRALPEHEDVDLAARLSHHPRAASDEAEVITSARLDGRTPGGYAGYLRGLVGRVRERHVDA